MVPMQLGSRIPDGLGTKKDTAEGSSGYGAARQGDAKLNTTLAWPTATVRVYDKICGMLEAG